LPHFALLAAICVSGAQRGLRVAGLALAAGIEGKGWLERDCRAA
jgi:hypothetical protein